MCSYIYFKFLYKIFFSHPYFLYFAAGCLFAAVAGAVDPVNAIVFAKVLGIFILPDPQEQNDLAVLYGLIFLALGAISLIAFTTEVC